MSKEAMTRLDRVLLVAALLLALFFRFWLHDQTPPGMDFDEAFESLQAQRILTEPGYHPIFFPENNGVPPLNIYLTALVLLVSGGYPLAIRVVSGVVGSLTIPALYVLARRLFPLREPSDALSTPARRFLPFGASVILAVLPWHISFSRHGLEVILLPLWATLAVYFLWQGLAGGRVRSFVISGVFWGSAFYTYQGAWILPGLLVPLVLYKAIQERGFLRRFGGRLALLVVSAALTVLPLAVFASLYPEAFLHRTKQVSIFALGQGSQTPLQTLAGNVLKVGNLFLSGGDLSIADNLPNQPVLPLPLTVLLVLGLLLALRRFKRPEYAFPLICFLYLLLPSVITENAPSIRRAAGAAPVLALLVALGGAWLFDVPGRLARAAVPPRALRPVMGVLAAALLIYAGIWGYSYYFLNWSHDPDLYHYYDVGLVDLGKYAAASPPATRLYYTPAPAGNMVHLPLHWQLRDRDLRIFDGHWGLVLPPPDAPAIYLITDFLGDLVTLPALEQIYPQGQIAYETRNRFGVLHSQAFAVDSGASPALETAVDIKANFADQIELIGASLSAAELHPSEPLTVTLVWRSLAGPTDVDYIVFTHLTGPSNAAGASQVWAGHDSPPLNHSYPTRNWGKGEIIVDRHRFDIPPETPPGAYRIEVGLYAPEKGGARLTTLDAGKDSVAVATVTIK